MHKLYFQVIHKLYFFITIGLIFASVTSLNSLYVESLPASFDKSYVLQDQDLYGLPLAFSSASAIQSYFELKGSLLANLYVPIGFESDDTLIQQNTFSTKPTYLRPLNVVGPYFGKSLLVSELLWKISREDFGNSCNLTFKEICSDNRSKPINPAFLIALIQKESGTVYGANSKRNPNDAQTQFLLDRVVGYYCFENPDPAKSCYDQNPNWRFFKGFFKQIYFASRLLRSWEQRCQLGGAYSFKSGNSTYFVGQNITIDGSSVYLGNAITCSLYIYTPHYSAQSLFYNIMKDLKADQNLVQVYNLKPGETPKPVVVGRGAVEKLD